MLAGAAKIWLVVTLCGIFDVANINNFMEKYAMQNDLQIKNTTIVISHYRFVLTTVLGSSALPKIEIYNRNDPQKSEITEQRFLPVLENQAVRKVSCGEELG